MKPRLPWRYDDGNERSLRIIVGALASVTGWGFHLQGQATHVQQRHMSFRAAAHTPSRCDLIGKN